MQPVNLFDLATQQAKWLSVRQTTVASNVANINTPGYRALEVEPFENVLNGSRVALKSTNPNHLQFGATNASFAVGSTEDPAVLPSENTVKMEDELANAGEVRRSFELNTAIVKAFHRMLMNTSRG
ncbi:flagellar basal body rod protein FlgB [Nitratireductor rhodophyticola]|uniref:Flagellar basal-body rod protein FlgB n=2 Tax=Nitratireductor aquibiodomus TaxID=204799 RepID=A0A1H4JGD4_9HYPH|nr:MULTISPECIES: flagellar basal body rod protein FlgB [Nitratireductor]EIM74698.1 flagellar basal body rod protein FlgB [Nitratireductor aquibiodomus RA22]MEC9245787.1 flagellar basal body rod protein FlgB [Pseudomonadota bacterium]WPZ12685.1 flagellar basal body rod protein FlgB [Nitratireductor rhodophyticola]SEB45360.1 flagellar basal-body rod protein FlgB [Nitratireductor aquibiodomus]